MSLTVTLNEKTTGVFAVHPVGSIDTSTYTILENKVDTILQGAPKVIVFDMEFVESTP